MKTFLASTAVIALLSTASFAQDTGTEVPGAQFIAEWDINLDGSVSLDDVSSRRSDIFATFDADDNGILDAAEYAFFDQARASAHSGENGNGGDRKAAVGFTLAFNDVNGDGAVTLDEFLGKSADWLAILDRNGDGVVTTADFGPQG